ncbi:hypothetical protein ABZ456_17605, partial [Streptomyces sp. NPDC005776]
MEFRDWLGRGRRQQAGTPGSAPVEGGTGDGTVPAPGPESVQRADSGATPGAVAPARPDADWDGGWRRVAPPAVTVARSSIGVSDGLRFRSRLASWQNVAYGGELGHAVLPSAPVGLIHGVARPGVARPMAAGSPLLLRAAGAPGQEEPGPVQPSSSAGPGRAPATVQRSAGGSQARSGAGRGPVGTPPVAPGLKRYPCAGGHAAPDSPPPDTPAAG